MKKLFGFLVLLAISLHLNAQTSTCTFIKEISGFSTTTPRIFKDPGGGYFLTGQSGTLTNIAKTDDAGNIVWSTGISLADPGSIYDMIVDQSDGGLVAIVKGTSQNTIFKFYPGRSGGTGVFAWIRTYQPDYMFENIHETNGSNYVVTGEILYNGITIFSIDQATGVMTGFQRTAFTGEFYSTWDGAAIYGACRYYTDPNLFNPSLFKFDPATGANSWTATYIKTSGVARIYPVAPVVDQGFLVQLSSGNDNNFLTYADGPNKIWLLKATTNGYLFWTKQITISGYSRFITRKVLSTATGYYLLIDAYNGSITDYFFIVKTDKQGNVQWARRFGNGGVNSALSAVEDNGYICVTALSGSYGPGNKVLFLRLNTFGDVDNRCPYITSATASAANYSAAVNNMVGQATPNTNYTNAAGTGFLSGIDVSLYNQCTGCPAQPKPALVNTPVKGKMNVYPNPCEGQVSISAGSSTIHSVSVYSNTSVVAGPYAFNGNTVSIPMDHLAPGMYFLKITTDEGVVIEKVIRK